MYFVTHCTGHVYHYHFATQQSTASKTHGRDANLSFSVMVRDVDHLQRLIDSIMRVENVMTCDRVFGK
jgi:(p)ppGpp synthase/HD superfamily hydrolase